MKKQINFDLNENYFEYGKADRANGIFDTSYLDRSPNATLSYISGWKSVDEDKLTFERKPLNPLVGIVYCDY